MSKCCFVVRVKFVRVLKVGDLQGRLGYPRATPGPPTSPNRPLFRRRPLWLGAPAGLAKQEFGNDGPDSLQTSGHTTRVDVDDTIHPDIRHSSQDCLDALTVFVCIIYPLHFPCHTFVSLCIYSCIQSRDAARGPRPFIRTNLDPTDLPPDAD